jgi:hypothetical protein
MLGFMTASLGPPINAQYRAFRGYFGLPEAVGKGLSPPLLATI